MEIISYYVIEEALILIPALSILGIFLKKTPRVPDWLIIWILLGVGIILACLLLGFNVQALLQGIFVTGVAVLGHQLIKQTVEKGTGQWEIKWRQEDREDKRSEDI